MYSRVKATPTTTLKSPEVGPTAPEGAAATALGAPAEAPAAAAPPPSPVAAITTDESVEKSLPALSDPINPNSFPSLDNFFAVNSPAEPSVVDNAAPALEEPVVAAKEQNLLSAVQAEAAPEAADAGPAIDAAAFAADEDDTAAVAEVAAAADTTADKAAFDFQREIAKLVPQPAELVPAEDFLQTKVLPGLVEGTANDAVLPQDEEPISVLVSEAGPANEVSLPQADIPDSELANEVSLIQEQQPISFSASDSGFVKENELPQEERVSTFLPQAGLANEASPPQDQPINSFVLEADAANEVLLPQEAANEVLLPQEAANEEIAQQAQPISSLSQLDAGSTTEEQDQETAVAVPVEDQLTSTNGLSTAELLKNARLRLQQIDAKERGP